MSKKAYLIILKGGVLLSLLSVFLVFRSFLFPYISSKQIYFNILVEILVVFWLAFLIKFPEYRPKKSWITLGLVFYFLAILISSFLGVDFNLSYWGDIERMLGFFHLFHFFLLYLIIITVFRTWKDWKMLFITSVIFASFVSIKTIIGAKESTIGNTSYVAGYLIFNIYFTVLLFFKENDRIFKWLYLLPLLVFFPAFFKADSTGGLVGLGFSFLIFVFLFGVLNKNKKLKITTSILFFVLVALVVFVLVFKDKEPLKNYDFLNPIREISLQKNTFQTRLISWKAAFKDLPNHPFWGTGFGNYAITFDKYFDADFYTYTDSETYFDRAHNNLIDILSTTGIIGLGTYSIFIIAAFVYLIQGYRNRKIGLSDFIIVTCLLIGYLVQNLAVFDSLVTYIALMMTLGYVYWLINGQEEINETEYEELGLLNKEVIALITFSLISLFFIYQYNVKPAKMLTGTIEGLSYLNAGRIWEGYNMYKDALSYDTPLDRDSRFAFIRSFLSFSDSANFNNLSQEQKDEIIDFDLKLALENLALSPNDNIANLQVAQSFQKAALLNIDNIQLSNNYINEALKYVNKAIELSPERITTFFIKVQILLNVSRTQEAIDLLEYAITLNPDYPNTYCNLSQIYIKQENKERGYELLDKCIDFGGLSVMNNLAVLKNVASHYSNEDLNKISNEDKLRLIKIYQQMASAQQNDPQIWINLAKLYENLGEYKNAIEAAQRAAVIDPSLKTSVDIYERDLEKKINN